MMRVMKQSDISCFIQTASIHMTNSLCEELISLSRFFFCFKMRWSNLFFFYFKICSWFTLYFSVIYKVYLQVNDCIILCFVFVVCLCKSARKNCRAIFYLCLFLAKLDK